MYDVLVIIRTEFLNWMMEKISGVSLVYFPRGVRTKKNMDMVIFSLELE